MGECIAHPREDSRQCHGYEQQRTADDDQSVGIPASELEIGAGESDDENGSDHTPDRSHAASDGHVLALGDPARLDDVVEALACNH